MTQAEVQKPRSVAEGRRRNRVADNVPWPKERIEALLARGQFSYQRIELPYGLSTNGKDRSSSADRMFPENLAGKTVLDLGCNHGYFCFEALRRGAMRVVGYDHSPMIIRRAARLAQAKGVIAEFEWRDLNHEPVTETFDYVLCLNVLHHLDNPLLQLERMMSITRETLVLEIAGFSLFDCFCKLEVVPFFAFFAFLLTPFPVVFIGRVPGATPDAPHRLKYYFTRRAMLRLFEKHKDVFPRVEIVRSRFKRRYLLIAHRV
ncbi:MAG: methyltransferase domain-containing protein [Gammaproteobacteria bacterium]|nr:methyltransferase domain-containing protein [Gammaproteobacteria bacterium]MBP6050234.1 methyltransferase domain-containing protein [Pseudomonadales bacterium]MBK6583846.1 methyltransferase domain-containing protein [Gammaproteobacteria bacterium]MBK7169747.1 methyltransferase domain-containing protein [Gammaproteobacteria bacterium]MBK7522183.1 methyltransferase domain-containing protein [Gammaproteobacteria bacterium]